MYTPEQDQRRTAYIMLTLVGASIAYSLLPLIPEGETVKRNSYADRESCVEDYSVDQCAEDRPSAGGSTSSVHYWFGPNYAANRQSVSAGDPGPGRVGLATQIKTSVRGGFGALGRFGRAIG